MSAPPRTVIVGAGPAGVRAAQTLVAHGLRPVVVDEGIRAGGQIYRQRPPSMTGDARAMYGFQARRATQLHRTFEALRGSVDHHPDSSVWGADEGVLHVLHSPSQKAFSLPVEGVILATGATDRVLPVPGWTLPGCYTLGGAQIALKFQSVLIGRRVVFMGTGPLLYLVAWQYMRSGADVVAVLDTTPRGQAMRAMAALCSQPRLLAMGLYYVANLRWAGVALHDAVQSVHIDGDDRVERVAWRDHGVDRVVECDAVALGHGLRSENQLADLLGCSFIYSSMDRAHVPRVDACGRTSVPNVYVAGDGGLIRGADAAEMAGELAALALLQDGGVAVDQTRLNGLKRRLNGLTRFRAGLEQAFPMPVDWAKDAPDALVVCRCEHVTAGELRQAAQDFEVGDINRLKALCRVGMGRCQGRMCAAAAADILAQSRGMPLQDVGRLRAQAPLKPLPIAALAES